MASKLAPKRAEDGTDISDGNVIVSETIPKARWDDIKTESLLKICVEEVQAGNRPHTHFTKEAEENLEYLKWRNEGPKFLDMMEICFKDMVAIGYMALVPYADPSTDNEVSNHDVQNDMNERETNADNFHVDEKKSATDKLQESFDRLISGMDNMSRSTSSKAQNEDLYSIGKCVDLLDMMPGVERGRPEYYLMVRMFARKTYRETFVHLMDMDPSFAKGWMHTFNLDNIDRF
ncbi:hypothetical protein IHE45_17G065200 [Dioscorea alata]|uniref:Uncharacterized protein n=1 Tax=Dioscorea alata TaxID=55571 RepID=A0ACB7UCZ6_DIOAL|nr:hypothetical protein IHE45_17G065200 [Dioscorea alata]